MNIRIPVANAVLGHEEANAVRDVVLSGRISAGQHVQEFERIFAHRLNAKNAIAANSGTAALHLALCALGIGPGDEVVVPSLTFIATANVVLYQGAELVLSDCDPTTFNMTAKDIKKHLSPRTKMILAVEMNGLPLDYDEILPVAQAAGVPVIVDSAESLGSSYSGQPIGTQGLMHCFSFFPNKSITTGEGGIVTTEDDNLAHRVRMLANQGQEGRYNHIALGFNYRMTDIQGALGTQQMKRLRTTLTSKASIAESYDNAFSSEKGIGLPIRPDYVTSQSWFMYSIRLRDRTIRDRVAQDLADDGIETRVGFPPIHLQPYYLQRFRHNPDDFPGSNSAWDHKLDLPCWPGLPQRAQSEIVNTVIESVRSSE